MSNHFEQHLRQQAPREIPREWRAEILATTPRTNLQSLISEPAASFLSFLSSHLSLVRWGALAAVWVAILALNHAGRDTTLESLAGYTPPSPEMILVLREQKKLLAELVNSSNGTALVDRPKFFSPRPHSELRLETITV